MMNPKIIIVGYPSSQIIVPVSKYLTEKYLPQFHTIYLNNDRGPERWSEYVVDFLDFLTDKFVIFALDDYLISAPINMIEFEKAMKLISWNGTLANVKLCQCSIEEHKQYPSTTQYSIWDREYLISLLRQVKSPWEFELEGSRILEKERTAGHVPCIDYFTNSALSSRWIGIRLDGLSQSDINYIKSFYGKEFIQ